MIHPELREKGKSLRKGQKFSVVKTKMMKRLCRLPRGRHSKNMHYEQKFILRPDGSKLRLCVYSPLERKENVPGLLWIHGGGYTIGIPEQDDAYILRFVQASGSVVVSPDYTLALDRPYPAALDDCYLALCWLRDFGPSYGMNPNQIFVGGNSAGGGLAAAVSLYARDKGEVNVSYQMLLYPMLDDRPTESSTNNDAPVWDSVSNAASWRLYLGDLYGSVVPTYAAPGRETNFENLPPTFAFVGGIEPFLDETVTFMENLKKSGVPTEFKIYDGCFHAFDQMCKDTEIARQATIFLMDRFSYAAQHYFSEDR
jgi:acetyl esterase/lipase